MAREPGPLASRPLAVLLLLHPLTAVACLIAVVRASASWGRSARL